MGEKKYDYIIWDWNGTLLDDTWLCAEVMNRMLDERQLPLITVEIYRNIFNFPVKDYYLMLGFNFDLEPFEKVGMEFMTLYNQRQKECNLHPEIPVLLQKIKDLDYSQSILSAREQNELRTETKERKVDLFFDLIYGLDDHYAHGKTDVGFKLLNDLAIPKERLIFIGDTVHDSKVATELGIDCILIPKGHYSRKRLETCNHPVIDSLSDLFTYL